MHGRGQLLREATEFSEEYVARRFERASERGAVAAIEALFDHYRESLVATDFRDGCPVVAVAVESSQDGPDLRDAALAAFEGSLILSRTSRDLAPLETVHREIRGLVQAALSKSEEPT